MHRSIALVSLITLLGFQQVQGDVIWSNIPDDPQVAEFTLDVPTIEVQGDLSGDGYVTMYDVAKLEDILLNAKDLGSEALSDADANEDGSVDISDLIWMLDHRSDAVLNPDVIFIGQDGSVPNRGTISFLIVTDIGDEVIEFKRLGIGPPSVRTGDILYSRHFGGFINRVVDLEIRGNRITAITEPASLSSVFRQAQFRGEFLGTGQGVNRSLTNMQLLEDYQVGSAEVQQGTMVFEPTVNLDFTIEDSQAKLVNFSMDGVFDVDWDLGIYAPNAGHWSHESIVPGSQVFHPFSVGQLRGMVSLHLVSKMEVHATGPLNVNTQIDLEVPVNFSQEWRDGELIVDNGDLSAAKEDLSVAVIDSIGDNDIRFSLAPEVHISFYRRPFVLTRLAPDVIIRSTRIFIWNFVYHFSGALEMQSAIDLRMFDDSLALHEFPHANIWGPVTEPEIEPPVDYPVDVYYIFDDSETHTVRVIDEQWEGSRAPVKVPMLFDGSGSLAGTDPDRIRVVAGKAFVDALSPEDRAAIFEFGAGPNLDFTATHLLQDFTGNRTLLRSALDQLQESGGTPLHTSIIETLDYLNTTQADIAAGVPLMVFSDGVPGDPVLQPDSIALAQQYSVPLISIGLGPAADGSPSADPRAVDVMRQLADETNGTYIAAVTSGDLIDAFAHFLKAINSRLLRITLQIDPPPQPGTELKIGLITDHGNVLLIHVTPGDPIPTIGQGVAPAAVTGQTGDDGRYGFGPRIGDLILLGKDLDPDYANNGIFSLRTFPIAEFNEDLIVTWDDWDGWDVWTHWEPSDGDPLPERTSKEFVTIEGGPFLMGDPFAEGDADELPVHEVSLTEYDIGIYEVTNDQYAEFLNSAYAAGDIEVVGGVVYLDHNPIQPLYYLAAAYDFSQIKFENGQFIAREREYFDMGEHPVLAVSWYGAAAYCNWRSRQEGRDEVYYYEAGAWNSDLTLNGYHLPTEAQWERAAAWSATEERHWRHSVSSDSLDFSEANFQSSTFANPLGFIEFPYTNHVGGYVNSFNNAGCHDIAGNLREWCHDWYNASYYSESPSVDPPGPSSSGTRVTRGGSWQDSALDCRSSNRRFDNPGSGKIHTGFRLVRTP